MISFIIPFHNEEDNVSPIDRVISYGKKQDWHFEIIPVDDRSNDDTKIRLQEFQKKYSFVKPIYRTRDSEEKGNTMGKALIEGTKKAQGDLIIWTMGDLTDKQDTYGEIINKLKSGSDLVFGSRYMIGGSHGNLDKLKAFLSSWGTRLARLLFNIPVNDITNAFRGFRKKAFTQLILTSPGFSISPEFAVKAHLSGFKLAEVPTIYTDRVKGTSNFRLYKMSISYLNIYLNLFIRYKLLKKPLDFFISSKANHP